MCDVSVIHEMSLQYDRTVTISSLHQDLNGNIWFRASTGTAAVSHCECKIVAKESYSGRSYHDGPLMAYGTRLQSKVPMEQVQGFSSLKAIMYVHFILFCDIHEWFGYNHLYQCPVKIQCNGKDKKLPQRSPKQRLKFKMAEDICCISVVAGIRPGASRKQTLVSIPLVTANRN
jgi:hypothetical protein